MAANKSELRQSIIALENRVLNLEAGHLKSTINILDDRVKLLETQVKLLIQAIGQTTQLINLLGGQQDEDSK